MTEPSLSQRITDYLASGGLFNPEQAEHIAVRDLLMECRTALDSAAGTDAIREAVILLHHDTAAPGPEDGPWWVKQMYATTWVAENDADGRTVGQRLSLAEATAVCNALNRCATRQRGGG